MRHVENELAEQPRIPVGILGATGAVGQKFIELLDGHPWFEITALAGSERSAGQRYGDVVRWKALTPIPDRIASMVVENPKPGLPCRIVFSALPSSVAGSIERAFADAGYVVISNSRNHRMFDDVPLVIPEVNADHMALIELQSSYAGGGFIVTNPNCSTTGLVSALSPLHDAFGVEAVQVTTMQALSGAGYPGVASLDALGNIIPLIPDEEEKLESEPRKILGTFTGSGITDASVTISAQCNRVPVIDGHMISVSVRFEREVRPAEVETALRDFETPEWLTDLPSAPDRFVAVQDAADAPQPGRHLDEGNGMTVSVGRIQACRINHVKFVALVHNTVRGAAGGAILNAELLASRGLLEPSERLAVTTAS